MIVNGQLDTTTGYSNTVETAPKYAFVVQHLNLSHSGLEEIPYQVLYYPRLRGLNIKDNKVDDLMPWFERLDRLELLNISNNLFTTLPNHLPKNIEWLDISGNPIEDISNLKFEQFRKLETLVLKHLAVRDLGLSVCRIKKLKRLYIDQTQIEQLPDCLCDLKKLRYLSIKNTLIKELLGCLESKKKLKIERN